jgi:hypothetical protein
VRRDRGQNVVRKANPTRKFGEEVAVSIYPIMRVRLLQVPPDLVPSWDLCEECLRSQEAKIKQTVFWHAIKFMLLDPFTDEDRMTEPATLEEVLTALRATEALGQ